MDDKRLRRRGVKRAGPRTRLARCSGALLIAGALLAPALAAQSEAPAGSGGMDARLDLLFGEHDPYRAFLGELQGAVATDQRSRVAALVSYPLKVKIRGHVLRIGSTQQFLSHYEELLPQATRAVIAAQSYEGLFVNSQGVMIGNGQLWFSGVCGDELCSRRTIKIIAFNPRG